MQNESHTSSGFKVMAKVEVFSPLSQRQRGRRHELTGHPSRLAKMSILDLVLFFLFVAGDSISQALPVSSNNAFIL